MNLNLRVLLILIFSYLPVHAQDHWASKTGIPVRRNRATSFTIGNFGYVGTGIAAQGGALNDFWRYDPITDSWTEIDSMPTLPRRSAFSFSVSGKGYVGGGVDELSTEEHEFWEYDPDMPKWTRKANFPLRAFAGETVACFSIGKKGFLLGTRNATNFYMYDPIINVWTARAQFPGEVVLGMRGFSVNGKGYIGSGFGNFRSTPEFWEYDPIKNQWSRKADLPSPRTSAVGFSIGNKGYIGLGLAAGNILLDDFWEYDPETDEWTQIAGCGLFAEYAIGMNIGSKGYVGTGYQFGGVPDFWEFDPGTSSVAIFSQLNQISIYPNPVRDMLHFDTGDLAIRTFSIYSVLGERVKTGLTMNNTIPVEDLPGGLYVLQIYFKDKVITGKFMKE